MNTTTHSQTQIASPPETAPPPTMRAIVQDRYGSSDTWKLRDIERPDIKPDEVLLQVHAAGLPRGTWHEMTGRPYLMRIMGFGHRRTECPDVQSPEPSSPSAQRSLGSRSATMLGG